MSFAINHNLDGLSKEDIKKYLDGLSQQIGLDPALNGLDTIYMNDPQGGRALVPYARRGTCEVLREVYGVRTETLTYATVGGSIVFTATGHNGLGRKEIAVGSKWVEGLRDKQLDNAIMTASTRALQRLTMQFTKYGILSESEVVDFVGQTPNPAGSAQLSANPLPPAFLPPPSVPANNAPGKPVEVTPDTKPAPAAPVDLAGPSKSTYPNIAPDAVASTVRVAFPGAKFEEEIGINRAAEIVAKADIKADIEPAKTAVNPVESTVTSDIQPDIKAAKKRKPKGVVLDVEPETVIRGGKLPNGEPSGVGPTGRERIELPAPGLSPAEELVQRKPELAAPPISVPVVGPDPVQTVAQNPPIQGVSVQSVAVEGMPSKEQMDDYRKKISVYTVQLPASQDLGPTQKMRAFITKMSGTPPQNMTVDQWDETVAFFDGFMERNQGNVKNLIKYIDDMLGVK